jgi:predicted transposase/invertase (TIGR01784 family)
MFDTIKADDKTKELIRLREKGERDFNSAIKLSRIEGERRGEKRGEISGEKRGKREVAKKLLLMGMTLQDIQAITELSAPEIELLQQKNVE